MLSNLCRKLISVQQYAPLGNELLPKFLQAVAERRAGIPVLLFAELAQDFLQRRVGLLLTELPLGELISCISFRSGLRCLRTLAYVSRSGRAARSNASALANRSPTGSLNPGSSGVV